MAWLTVMQVVAADKYPAVKLAADDLAWAERYREISASLMDAPGPGWAVEHVGSTSVPGLLAKPVIDLALGLPRGASVGQATKPLLGAGWTEPEAVGDHGATYLLVDGLRVAIGHIFAATQWPEAHPRLFAEWLRAHDADRDRYGRLKGDLVAAGTWGGDYTEAKAAFVRDIVNRARSVRGWAPTSGPL